MSIKSLEIKAATIEIKVVRVDGHKMTKATFRQILDDKTSEIDRNSILGWVNDENSTVVIWNMNGSPRKRKLVEYGYNGGLFFLNGQKLPKPNSFHKIEYQEFYRKKKDEYIKSIKENYSQLFIAT